MEKNEFIAACLILRAFCSERHGCEHTEVAILSAAGMGVAADSGNTGTWIAYQFGAYGCIHVLVSGDGSVCGGLEAAAGTLTPDYFVEPDYAAARAEILGDSGRGDDMIADDEVQEHAEADLTYTESGWLCSWEWTLVELGSFADACEYAFDVHVSKKY